MHSKLTKEDPQIFWYLRTRLFLLHMSLTSSKTHLSWYLDSGYSWNMTRERCMFHCLIPMHGGTVTFEGNKKWLITWVCKIGIPPYSVIDNVLFVEGLKHNMWSINQLSDSEYDVSYNKDECIIQNSDVFLLFSANRKGNLYNIRLGELSDQNASYLMSIKEGHWVWRKKLGHASLRLTSKLQKHNFIRGLPSMS